MRHAIHRCVIGLFLITYTSSDKLNFGTDISMHTMTALQDDNLTNHSRGVVDAMMRAMTRFDWRGEPTDGDASRDGKNRGVEV